MNLKAVPCACDVSMAGRRAFVLPSAPSELPRVAHFPWVVCAAWANSHSFLRRRPIVLTPDACGRLQPKTAFLRFPPVRRANL
jgi:hypothetical protein